MGGGSYMRTKPLIGAASLHKKIPLVPRAKVEKVKSVSGNLRIEPKTFCKNEGVRHEKKIYFSPMKVQQFKFSLHFWDVMKNG